LTAQVPDAIFAHPRLAGIYDAVDGVRDDLDAYLAIVDELGARRVLDVGCGTGTFALLLAARGLAVTGVDPAQASLAVARGKPGAAGVRWIHGTAHSAPRSCAEVATMTGNVAQAIVTDEDWAETLDGVHDALASRGHLVFETRDPAFRGWEEWCRERSHRVVHVPGVGPVESWVELTDVDLPLVSFRWTFVFRGDGQVLTSDSTLRFRERDEVEDSLAQHGYPVVELREAPDRPGRELVFLARRSAVG
jgi:SAM-dependent methyltransferase